MKRPLVLLLLALAVAATGALSVWLVLGGAQTGATQVGPPSEINEIPLYNGALNVEKDGTRLGGCGDVRYEVDASVAEVENFYKEALAGPGWHTDWVRYRRVGGDSVNLDWRAPKYDDTALHHFYTLNEQRDRPYDVSVILEASDNRGVNATAAKSMVDVSLCRIPRLDEIPVFPGATEIERAGQLTFYRTAATLDELRTYYLDLLPSYGWYYVGDATDPAAGESLPGTLSFGYTIHGFRATLQIKAETASNGGLTVRMKASGSGLVPNP